MTSGRERLTGHITVPLPPGEAYPLFTPRGEQAWAHGWHPSFPAAAPDDTIQFKAVSALDDTIQFTALTGWSGRWPAPDQPDTRRERAEPGQARGSPRRDDSAGSIVRKPLNALRGVLADPMLRNGHALIASASVTQLVGVAFWIFAARLYPVAVV